MDYTPLADALPRLDHIHHPDETGRLHPIGPPVEVLVGHCVEPPGRRPMTYVVVASGSGLGPVTVSATPSQAVPTR